MAESPMDDNSRILLESASQGDAAAIEVLLERNLPRLRAYIRLRMGPQLRAKESSADLAQSACREVLQNLGRFQYQGESNFRRWLFTTALRKVKNRVQYYQAEKRDVKREGGPAEDLVSLSQVYGSLVTPSQEMMRREYAERFEAVFAQLPEHYREVILLSRVVGLSHREIAATMERTESSTRNLLYRALAELATALDSGDSP